MRGKRSPSDSFTVVEDQENRPASAPSGGAARGVSSGDNIKHGVLNRRRTSRSTTNKSPPIKGREARLRLPLDKCLNKLRRDLCIQIDHLSSFTVGKKA